MIEDIKEPTPKKPKLTKILGSDLLFDKNSVTYDWKAYFKAFCEKHGTPIPYDGRLLFPDGWMYSSTEYKGPEWPPSPENIKTLKALYARIHRTIIKNEIVQIKALIEGIESLQDARDVPLYQKNIEYDEDSDTFSQRSTKINVEHFKVRLSQLERTLKSISLPDNTERGICNLCHRHTEDLNELGCPVGMQQLCPNTYR